MTHSADHLMTSATIIAGLGGKIVSSKGYDVMGNGAADYPKKAKLTYQVSSPLVTTGCAAAP